jgi:predicted O-methyltransferase YrrM
MVVASVKPKRFLEVGCGLGYTAALMADAGGPEARVDTIESDPLHADLAEAELSRRGLAGRVRVLRGDENDIIPTLTRTYDVVFMDGGRREGEDWPELKRLTRQGGVRISKQVMRDEVGRIVARLVESGAQGEQRVQRAYAEAEKAYREAVGRSMTVPVTRRPGT